MEHAYDAPAAAIAPVPLDLVERDLDAAARALGDSFERTGFAVVEGHGVPADVIAVADAAARRVWALPPAEKALYHIPGTGGARGYTPFGVETAKDASAADLKEFWHVGRALPAGHAYEAVMPPNVWPAAVPEFAPAVSALYAALDQAGARILRAVARHIGVADDFFVDATRDGNSVLRLLHYPPVPEDAGAVRAGAHEDINVITLLLGAEEAGLQLLDRGGTWRTVTPAPGALVVNVGDMLARLTGGRLPSTTHRVVNPRPERRHLARLSTPFFLHFRPDFLITPMAGDEPPITANDYLQQRLREIRLL